MHPDIANQLAEFHRTELLAEAEHQRLVNVAKRARARRTDRGVDARHWWRVLLPSRAFATE